jgi:site-specific DNA-methyltransferase (adenine-specific)/modification methylase
MTEPRKEVLADGIEIWMADCRNVLPLIGRVDAVVTDPPYGVSLSGKAGHYRNNESAKRSDTYLSYDDTPENFDRIIVPAVARAISIARSSIVFMADKSIFKLPPGHIGGIFLPNGCGMTAWGFQNFMHAVLYGADPFLAAGLGSRPNGKYGLYGNDSNKIDHPCAKPLAAMEWAVTRVSFDAELILDPFMGSGTTGVACVNLGRKFIGIEKEPKYFDIARRRINEALSRPRLPFDEPVQVKQEILL